MVLKISILGDTGSRLWNLLTVGKMDGDWRSKLTHCFSVAMGHAGLSLEAPACCNAYSCPLKCLCYTIIISCQSLNLQSWILMKLHIATFCFICQQSKQELDSALCTILFLFLDFFVSLQLLWFIALGNPGCPRVEPVHKNIILRLYGWCKDLREGMWQSKLLYMFCCH
jgi:hypothetical protein